MEAQRYAEAEQVLRRLVSTAEDTLPPKHYFHGRFLTALGRTLLAEQRFEEAEGILLEAYDQLSDLGGSTSSDTRHALRSLVTLYEKWEKAAEADRFRALLEAAASR